MEEYPCLCRMLWMLESSVYNAVDSISLFRICIEMYGIGIGYEYSGNNKKIINAFYKDLKKIQIKH